MKHSQDQYQQLEMFKNQHCWMHFKDEKLTQFVGVLNVLGMVLIVVNLQSTLANMRLKSVVSVRKRRES